MTLTQSTSSAQSPAFPLCLQKEKDDFCHPLPTTHTHTQEPSCCHNAMLYDGDSEGHERFLGHVVLSARFLCSAGQISPLDVNIALLQTRSKRWNRRWEKVRHRWEGASPTTLDFASEIKVAPAPCAAILGRGHNKTAGSI